MVVNLNADKPHRCPDCHTITDPEHKARWRVVSCCRCGCEFTRFPLLSRILPYAGIVCPEHHPRRTT